MEQVAIITEPQYLELVGQEYTTDSYFNPVLDCTGNWIISSQEIDNCTNPNFQWVKSLVLIDWCGPYVGPPSGTTVNYFDQYFSGSTSGNTGN